MVGPGVGGHLASLNSLEGKERPLRRPQAGRGDAAARRCALGSLPRARPHQPATANIDSPGECHPLACPLLLGAGAAATQRVPPQDA